LTTDVAALRETLRKASRGELEIQLSPLQYDQIKTDIRQALSPLYMALALGLGAIGAWMAGVNELAYGLLGMAIMGILFRR